MEQKILLIDNDESTIQLFMQVAAALNIDYLILHNWSRTVKLPDKKSIKAVFINVELNFLDLSQLWKEFMSEQSETSIPIFLLFSRTFSKCYLAAKKLPHSGEIKKPLKAEELFEVLSTCINLEQMIEYPEDRYRQKLVELKNYRVATSELINKLEAYFD